MYVLLGTALTLTSCVDEDKNLAQPEEKTTDLKVPADFPWETMRSVKLTFNESPVDNTRLSIYTESSCNEESLVGALNVSANQDNSITVDIAESANKLYVKYPTEGGSDKFTVSLSGGGTRANDIANERVFSLKDVQGLYNYEGSTDENGLNVVITSGTLVFEDNWPTLGDYDFNDLVADYKVQTHYTPGNPDHYQYERINVSVTFRAVGGYHPDKLGLQFLGIDNDSFKRLRNKYIASTEGLDVRTKGITVKLENKGEEDIPVFIFEGLSSLRNGKDYYNTEKADDTDLVTVSFSIYFNLKNNLDASSALTQSASAFNQDFFLITNEKREIHLKGYGPSALYTNYDKDLSLPNAEVAGSTYYCTDKNFVWGMKLPRNFKHPKEKIDISEAYTGFKGWVESNALNNQEWYKTPVAGKVISVK